MKAYLYTLAPVGFLVLMILLAISGIRSPFTYSKPKVRPFTYPECESLCKPLLVKSFDPLATWEGTKVVSAAQPCLCEPEILDFE